MTSNTSSDFARTQSSTTVGGDLPLNAPPGYRIGNFRVPFSLTFSSNVALILVSVVLNSLLLAGLKRDSRLKAVTYNYVSSLCWAMLIQCLLCFPPGVLQEVIGPGHSTLLNTLCIAWIYMDTFLCNLVFLHCLGSTIDTWLRLRYPMRYAYSTTRGSTCLKLGAPWSVGFIQTTAEFAVSKQHDGLYHSGAGVCLHKDPNFVILRVCMSYALPGLASLLMLSLGFCQFSRVRGQQDPELVSELIRSYHKQQRVSDGANGSVNGLSDFGARGSNNGVLDLSISPSGEDASEADRRRGAVGSGAGCSHSTASGLVSQSLPRDCTRETLLLFPSQTLASASIAGLSRDTLSAFELCRMTPIPEAPDETGSACNVPSSRSCHTFKPSSGGVNNLSGGGGGGGAGSQLLSPAAYILPEMHPAMTACPVHSAAAQQLHRHHRQLQQQMQQQQQPQMHELGGGLLESPSSVFAYDEPTHSGQGMLGTHVQGQLRRRQQQQKQQRIVTNSWRRMLRSEKSACRLNLCAFLVSLIFWSPYTLSSLVHCLCANFPCPSSLPPSPANIGDMKWIAYASCVAYPLFFIVADADIRRALGRAATCRDAAGSADTLVYGPTFDEDEDGDSGTLADSQA